MIFILKQKIDEGNIDIYDEKKILIKMPTELHIKDRLNKRTRGKKHLEIYGGIFNPLLHNTIKRTLTKIKEENEQNEIKRKTKIFLPSIPSKNKTGNTSKRSKNVHTEVEKVGK